MGAVVPVSDSDASPMISRQELDELTQLVLDGGPSAVLEPSMERFRGAAIVKATASTQAIVTDVRLGEVRRVELWLAPTGVVALPVQSDPDVAGPITALAPTSATEVVASAMGCSTGAVAASDSFDASAGLVGLVDEVLAGGRPGTMGTVIDWCDPGGTERWLVFDAEAGRVASLSAPLAPSAPLVLRPMSPMALAVALCERVSKATRAREL